MQKVVLLQPEGYDAGTSPVISTTAAQLDALLANLTRQVQDATVEELEWQLRPGVNTIGMLLAHLAVVEVYWAEAVGRGIESEEEADRIVRAVVGIRMNEDGLPLAEDGTHPRSLAGRTAADYLAMLGRARRATHRALRSWNDQSLGEPQAVGGWEISRAWLLYHLVEHFAHHLGQIALLASLRRRRVSG